MSNALVRRGGGSGIVPAACSLIVPGVGQLVNGETDKAIGDFEMRIEREIPSASLTYESWLHRARWQLLFLESLGVMVCIYLTRAVGLPKKSYLERPARIPL